MNPEPERVEVGPIEALRAIRVLLGHEDVSAAALAALARLATALRVPAGAHLTRERDPLGMVYFVSRGALRLSRGGSAMGVVTNPGAVGMLAALAGDTRGVDAVAVSETIVLAVQAEDVLEILEDHFDMMQSALRRTASEGIKIRRTLMPHAGFANNFREGLPCPARPLDLAERILYLRRTVGAQGYIDELTHIARAAQEVRYPAGSRLWSVGDRADHILVLFSGAVQGTTPEGAGFRLGTGDLVGNLDAVAGEPRWYDATVQQDLVALELDGEVMVDVWEDHPDLAFMFLRIVAAAQLSLREQVAELGALQSGRQEAS
jgi:CRP-like cAMP-binding protein